MTSTADGGFSTLLSQSVEGTVLGKRVVTCEQPASHPLYNSSIDEHFGTVPDRVLIASIFIKGPESAEGATKSKRATKHPVCVHLSICLSVLLVLFFWPLFIILELTRVTVPTSHLVLQL